MKKLLLNSLKIVAVGVITFDINATCTFIFGQKKLPDLANKYKKNV
ncbi:cyclic lactone autoinducer peptide [Candidatus Enterococcus courvalinii]|uniref:Cyclic lactone autoinducer peptide n=1 Tax=Candidatus Enterococcus courvalinii TaxID=2815329 RepID=A0ABS3I0L5_9ENTE|nr:cyclic lactone autoinducer peptide [Enterococcus sp. MSG2901]MBO0482200.1 cyclic lactone autoinducer peptide [Enterococcus sp. MSG2901]